MPNAQCFIITVDFIFSLYCVIVIVFALYTPHHVYFLDIASKSYLHSNPSILFTSSTLYPSVGQYWFYIVWTSSLLYLVYIVDIVDIAMLIDIKSISCVHHTPSFLFTSSTSSISLCSSTSSRHRVDIM